MPKFEVSGTIEGQHCRTIYEAIDIGHAEARGTMDGMLVDELRNLSTPGALPVRSDRLKSNRPCPFCGGVLQNAHRTQPSITAGAIGASLIASGLIILFLGGIEGMIGIMLFGIGLAVCLVHRNQKIIRCRDCRAIAAEWE